MRTHSQVESFKPFWAWDDPPKKIKKSKSGPRSGKTKTIELLPPTGTPAEGSSAGESDVPPPGVSNTERPGAGTHADPAMVTGGDSNMRKRQQAYIEDVEE